MTIERILICVLFLLMVRMEINFVRLAKKHNGLTTAMGILVDKLKKKDPEYKEYLEKEEDEHD